MTETLVTIYSPMPSTALSTNQLLVLAILECMRRESRGARTLTLDELRQMSGLSLDKTNSAITNLVRIKTVTMHDDSSGNSFSATPQADQRIEWDLPRNENHLERLARFERALNQDIEEHDGDDALQNNPGALRTMSVLAASNTAVPAKELCDEANTRFSAWTALQLPLVEAGWITTSQERPERTAPTFVSGAPRGIELARRQAELVQTMAGGLA